MGDKQLQTNVEVSIQLRFRPVVQIEEALPRRRLMDSLATASPGVARVTLICAPAGFGKTTLLAQLAAQRKSFGKRVAWLNFEPPDLNPRHFMHSVNAALAESWGSGGSTCRSLDARPFAAPAAAEEEVLLCVDDYHAESEEAIAHLLERIAFDATRNLSVVLASRAPPGHRLTCAQLAGSVRVVDAELLRFTREEALALLEGLHPDRADHVAKFADGWPFALQLAKLQGESAVGDLQPSRSCTAPRLQIFEYMAREVVSNLPAELRAFLLDVAILERIDVLSANALRERVDSAHHIRQLDRLKPIAVVDDATGGARLHPLLRSHLISTLLSADADRVSTLHARAARHLGERGQIHEAVGHAMASGSAGLAASLIEESGAIRLLANEGAIRTRMLLAELPEDTVRDRPRLRLLRLALGVVESNSAGILQEFERAQARLHARHGISATDVAIDLELASTLMLLHRSEIALRFSPWGTLNQAKLLAREYLTEEPRLLSFVLPVELFFLQRYGNVAQSEVCARKIEALYADGSYAYNRPWMAVYHARNALANGELDRAERNLRGLLERDDPHACPQQDSLRQLTAVLLGSIAYRRGDPHAALAHFASMDTRSEVTMLEILAGRYVGSALCRYALGDHAQAQALLEQARAYAIEHGLPHLALMAGAVQTRTALHSGNVEAARALAEELALGELWALAQTPRSLPWCVVEAIAQAQFSLAFDAKDLPRAHAVALALQSLAELNGHRPAILCARVMTALASGRQIGTPRSPACEALKQALAFGAELGEIQCMLDFGAPWLAAVRMWATTPEGPHESASRAYARTLVTLWDSTFLARAKATPRRLLTRREFDVLSELAQQRSTKSIGRTLGLSPETVKHHLKRIFSKLEVNTRSGAVHEARTRGIIP